MALYQNGILISGANTLPQMTLAEYQALPVSERPTYWERTDLNYNNIPASDVTYGSGSVEDALDNLAYESETLQNGVNIKRLGKLRVLYIAGTFTVNGGDIAISALPSKDRPPQNILGEVGSAKLNTKYYPFSINLKTDGTVTGFALDVTQTDGYKYLTGNTDIYATFTYAVN